ncbi:MAG: molybdate ABC transporter substrate-binding protein [Planctomycetota bacterium]
MPTRVVVTALSAALLAVSGLAAVTYFSATGPAQPQPIIVAAAASTTTAMEELIAAWHADGGTPVEATYASSSTLARQIEHGAPVAVYLSANQHWMDHLQTRALIDSASRIDLLANRLVVIAPQDSGLAPLDLIHCGVPEALCATAWSTGDPSHVPAGMYARESLTALGWWTALAPRLIAAKDIRAALRLVERAEVDWGVVYSTDAHSTANVRILARLPPHSHTPIVYPAALVTGAGPRAAAFLAWLASDRARAILERHGFGPAPGSPSP